MWAMFDLSDSTRVITGILLSLAFFVGIMLIVSQEAFILFNKALSKEMGIRKRYLPRLENKNYPYIDLLILKYPLIAGLVIAVTAFILLLVYR